MGWSIRSIGRGINNAFRGSNGDRFGDAIRDLGRRFNDKTVEVWDGWTEWSEHARYELNAWFAKVFGYENDPNDDRNLLERLSERYLDPNGDWAQQREDWARDVRDWETENLGIQYDEEGNLRFTDEPIRQPRWADWSDAYDPYLRGAHPSIGAVVPATSGYSIPMGAEFISANGLDAASGSRFIGHAPPQGYFQSMTITQSGIPLVIEPSEGPFWSARLVQRDTNGFPYFISGPVTSQSDDGLQYREDLRMILATSLRSVISIGGPLIPGLPMFITLATSDGFPADPIVGTIKVQVTVNLVIPPIP